MHRGKAASAATLLALGLSACSSSSPRVTSETPSSSASSSRAPNNSAAATTTKAPASRGPQWATYYGDNARHGVSVGYGPIGSGVKFTELWTSARLDGDVYAQPLVVGTRVVVATENNTVYALSLANGHVLWQRHLATPVPAPSLPCGNVDPVVGITGTPVVDVTAGRVYVVGMLQPARHELYALDLATGREIASTRADVPGSDPKVQNQRGALALANHTVYVPFGGRFGDCGDYHGQVESVAVTSSGFGAQRSYTLPSQREGGFWSPAGPVVAGDGSLFLASGNSSSTGTYDYGNTVVHLSATLHLLDSFAPRNWAALNAGDVDIGSTSPALLDDGRIFQVGKSGVGYLLDSAHLGGIGGERTSRTICPGQAFGSVAHRGPEVFVPCGDGIVLVTAGAGTMSIGRQFNVSAPGPAVIAGTLLWTVATGDGDIVAFDINSGKQVFSRHIGATPSRFTSPAAVAGGVVVAADRRIHAIG